MTREKPKEVYSTKVSKFGNGAKIKAYKKHIGKNVLISIFDTYYCGACSKGFKSESKAKNCCKDLKKNNLRIKSVIYGEEQLNQLTKSKEDFML